MWTESEVLCRKSGASSTPFFLAEIFWGHTVSAPTGGGGESQEHPFTLSREPEIFAFPELTFYDLVRRPSRSPRTCGLRALGAGHSGSQEHRRPQARAARRAPHNTGPVDSGNTERAAAFLRVGTGRWPGVRGWVAGTPAHMWRWEGCARSGASPAGLLLGAPGRWGARTHLCWLGGEGDEKQQGDRGRGHWPCPSERALLSGDALCPPPVLGQKWAGSQLGLEKHTLSEPGGAFEKSCLRTNYSNRGMIVITCF